MTTEERSDVRAVVWLEVPRRNGEGKWKRRVLDNLRAFARGVAPPPDQWTIYVRPSEELALGDELATTLELGEDVIVCSWPDHCRESFPSGCGACRENFSPGGDASRKREEQEPGCLLENRPCGVGEDAAYLLFIDVEGRTWFCPGHRTSGAEGDDDLVIAAYDGRVGVASLCRQCRETEHGWRIPCARRGIELEKGRRFWVFDKRLVPRCKYRQDPDAVLQAALEVLPGLSTGDDRLRRDAVLESDKLPLPAWTGGDLFSIDRNELQLVTGSHPFAIPWAMEMDDATLRTQEQVLFLWARTLFDLVKEEILLAAALVFQGYTEASQYEYRALFRGHGSRATRWSWRREVTKRLPILNLSHVVRDPAQRGAADIPLYRSYVALFEGEDAPAAVAAARRRGAVVLDFRPFIKLARTRDRLDDRREAFRRFMDEEGIPGKGEPPPGMEPAPEHVIESLAESLAAVVPFLVDDRGTRAAAGADLVNRLRNYVVWLGTAAPGAAAKESLNAFVVDPRKNPTQLVLYLKKPLPPEFGALLARQLPAILQPLEARRARQVLELQAAAESQRQMEHDRKTVLSMLDEPLEGATDHLKAMVADVKKAGRPVPEMARLALEDIEEARATTRILRELLEVTLFLLRYPSPGSMLENLPKDRGEKKYFIDRDIGFWIDVLKPVVEWYRKYGTLQWKSGSEELLNLRIKPFLKRDGKAFQPAPFLWKGVMFQVLNKSVQGRVTTITTEDEAATMIRLETKTDVLQPPLFGGDWYDSRNMAMITSLTWYDHRLRVLGLGGLRWRFPKDRPGVREVELRIGRPTT